MPLFSKKGNVLTLVNARQAESEKSVQRLIEQNLKAVLDMHLLASEYRTQGGRIDTLAVDSQGAPVVIEYKRKRDDNVINQSLSYLKWLTGQRPEFFESVMQKRLPEEVMENIRLDWQHPRVVCIAESFSKFDIDTVEMVPLRIELFKYRLYEGGLLSLDPVHGEKQCATRETMSQGAGDPDLAVIEAMKEQSQASHLIRTLFDELRERIMALDQYIVEKAGKRSISYRLSKNFAEILIRKDRLVISLRPIIYNDPRGMVKEIAEGYVVTMNRRITLTSPSDLDYACGIIEQSYKNVL
jgi:predicted transport protein